MTGIKPLSLTRVPLSIPEQAALIGGRLETVDSFWFWRNEKNPLAIGSGLMGNLESAVIGPKEDESAVRQYRRITVDVCMVPDRACTEYLDLELE